MIQYALFETAIGWAGIAWGDEGLVACHLPERDAETARRGFQRRFPDIVEAEAPAAFAPTIGGIQALQGKSPRLLLLGSYASIAIQLLYVIWSVISGWGFVFTGLLGFILPAIIGFLLLQPQAKQYYAGRGIQY